MMTKLTLPSLALAALLTTALWAAPAFAQDEQPPADEQATSGEAATGDGAADASSDAAPAGEEQPAE